MRIELKKRQSQPDPPNPSLNLHEEKSGGITTNFSSYPTTAQHIFTRQTLSSRALEKSVDEGHATSSTQHFLASGALGVELGGPSQAPIPPEAAFLNAKAVPLPHRPQPRYRRSFLEAFLARQQNREASSSTGIINSSRVLSPINHIPRPTPVYLAQAEQNEEEPTTRETRTLLSLPEQRRSRQNSPNSPTFQDSLARDPDDQRTSIGLPSSHRSQKSSDHRRSMSVEKPLPASPNGPSRQNTQNESPGLQTKLGSNYGLHEADQPTQPVRRVSSHKSMERMRSVNSLRTASVSVPNTSKPIPSLSQSPATHHGTPLQQELTASPDQDIERGPDQQEDEIAWGPTHPCFPHLNPHVPLHSPAYNATRIIRARRDWMVVGDLAPTYSNIYPEILDPILPEQEFRYIIDHINSTLIRAHDPSSTANWIDGILGFLTGWFWEDLRGGGIKGELKQLEEWIEEWNKMTGAADGVKIIPLRRTGYMSIDIQIPDPQVRVVESKETIPDDAESSATPRPQTAA